MIQLGTIEIRSANKWKRLKQFLKLKPSHKVLFVDNLKAKATFEICKCLKDLKSLEKDVDNPLFAQIADQLPLFTHIIVLSQKVNEKEAQEMKRAILEQWDNDDIAGAVTKIYGSIDFSGLISLLEGLSKIRSVMG